MKKVFIIFILAFTAILSGCNRPDNISEESSSTDEEMTHKPTEKETEKETQIKIVLGDVGEYARKERVFTVEDSEETDESVKWKNSFASAQLDVVGGWDDEVNCNIKYESSTGSISEIKLYIQLNQKLDTKFYEEDINDDGSDELIIIYTVATGTGSTEQDIYVYDFKNGKEIKPVGDDGGSFTAKQEQVMLQYYKKWYDMGITEFPNIKEGAEGSLPKELFIPSLVDYNGRTALKVEFMRDGPGDKKGVSTAIILYENGEFVVKEFWFEQI